MEHPELHGRSAEAWSSRVEIPATLEEAVEALAGIGRLMTARQWERSAVVYAFTRDGEAGERVDLTSSDFTTGLTPREFASMKVAGLASDQTVRRYRRTWAAAMDLGACVEAKPGMAVDLPDLDWDAMFAANAGGAHVANNGRDDLWCTPEEFIEAARAVLGAIDLDPASCAEANEVVKATTFYTPDDDGLAHEWHGRVWMNPPYSQPAIAQFIEKLITEHTSGRVPEAIVLINNATETGHFQDLGLMATGMALPRGRIKFWHPTRFDMAGVALQGQAVLYLGENHGKFVAEFSQFGLTW